MLNNQNDHGISISKNSETNFVGTNQQLNRNINDRSKENEPKVNAKLPIVNVRLNKPDKAKPIPQIRVKIPPAIQNKAEDHLPKINLPNLKLTNFAKVVPPPNNPIVTAISTEEPTHKNIQISRL